MTSLYILYINPLSNIWLANIFSHSVGCLFILLIDSFDMQKLFSFMWSDLFYHLCFRCHIQKLSLPKPLSWSFFLFFSSSFMVGGLKFKSFVNLEFIFMSGVIQGSNFILLHVNIPFSWDHLLKKLSFFHWVFLDLLNKVWLYTHGFISGLSICSIGLWVCFHTSTILFWLL